MRLETAFTFQDVMHPKREVANIGELQFKGVQEVSIDCVSCT